MPDNRRQSLRLGATGKVGLVLRGQLYICSASDVSIGGAALHTHAALAPGQDVVLHVGGLGQLPATVVRQLPEGVAIAFNVDAMDDTATLETWRRVLDRGSHRAAD